MEASQAGLAAGDAAAQNAGGEGEGSEGGQDVSALVESLGTLQAGQEDLRQFLLGQPWNQAGGEGHEGGEQEGGEEFDASALLESFDASDAAIDPEAFTQRLGGLIDQIAERRAQALVSQEVNPLKADVQEMRREREAELLVGEFPELEDPEIAQQVVSVSKQLATANGRPELAQEPWFWRMTYMAAKAAESANAEEGGNPQAATLEGGGGATPAASEVDPGDQIVQATGLGRRVLPFG